MNEITMTKFYDILYKFFAFITCAGLFFLSMDILLLLSRHSLYMAGHSMTGWYVLLPLGMDILMIILGYALARHHKKQSMAVKWR